MINSAYILALSEPSYARRKLLAIFCGAGSRLTPRSGPCDCLDNR